MKVTAELQHFFQIAIPPTEVVSELRVSRIPAVGWCMLACLSSAVISPSAAQLGRTLLTDRLPLLGNHSVLGDDILHLFAENPAVVAVVGLWLQGLLHVVWRPLSWWVESGHGARLRMTYHERGLVTTCHDLQAEVTQYVRNKGCDAFWWSAQLEEGMKCCVWMMTAIVMGIASSLPPVMYIMQDPSMQQNNLFAWRFYYAENGRLDDHIHSKTPDAMMNNIHINEALALRCELWHGFFLLLQVGLAYLAAQLGSSANSYRAKATQPVSQALHASRQSLLRASEQELPTRMVRASAPL